MKPTYLISRGADGKPFTKIRQVHMCENSVSPPSMAAPAQENDPWEEDIAAISCLILNTC